MTENNITFSKIVANPNPYAWSQAYSAGKLFAVISLGTTEEVEEKDYLNVVGKEILDTLEQEYFTLETKDLESIKKAVEVTTDKIPSSVECSFVVSTYVEDVLYLYILGGGKVSLKRGAKLGSLLEGKTDDNKELKSASGFLQDGDTVILQTKQFANVISVHTLSEFLDGRSPSEIAEHIAPLIHEKDEAGAAAIVIHYMTPAKHHAEAPTEEKEKLATESLNEGEKAESPFYTSSFEEETKSSNKLAGIKGIFSKFKPGRNEISHPRKVILSVVIIIVIILAASIVFAVKKQQDSKIQAVFQSMYPQASKKYDEGKSLLDLNANLAQDSFNQAKALLEDGKNKLPANSEEQKKVIALLTEVNKQIGQAPKPNAVEAKAVDSSTSQILAAEINNQGLYFSKDTNNIYVLSANSIDSLTLKGTSKKTVVKNDNYWTTTAGLANYYGNLYVLDKKQNQILKFVESDGSFSKANYFSDTTNLDFSKAVAIAIDSSIYVLASNGSINKYSKGSSESFTISGLDKDLSSPTRIYTNADTDNVYILDNGNSRIVVLDKTGKFKSQYQSGVVKTAKDLDVDEKNNKIYILSGGKVYEINIK